MHCLHRHKHGVHLHRPGHFVSGKVVDRFPIHMSGLMSQAIKIDMKCRALITEICLQALLAMIQFLQMTLLIIMMVFEIFMCPQQHGLMLLQLGRDRIRDVFLVCPLLSPGVAC